MKFHAWTTRVQYVDLDTGEMINWYNKEDWKIIRKIRNIKKENYENRQTGDGHTKGIITITNECRRIPRQSKLPFDKEGESRRNTIPPSKRK